MIIFWRNISVEFGHTIDELHRGRVVYIQHYGLDPSTKFDLLTSKAQS